MLASRIFGLNMFMTRWNGVSSGCFSGFWGQFGMRVPADDCTLAVSDHGEIFPGERRWLPPGVF